MEGANVGYSHNGTDFFDHFGTTFVHNGYQNVISTINGTVGTFTEGVSFGYPDSDPDYGIDQLAGDDGVEILISQDNICRGVMYDAEDYRTIIVAPILGCYNQSEMFSTRKYLMMEYVSFLADIEGPELYAEESEIVFENASPGEDVEAVLHLYNIGFLDLDIWEMNLEGDEFLTEISAPQIINAQGTLDIPISFRSNETGSFTGYLEIVSNDRDHENEVFILTGYCGDPAEIEVSVTEFNLEVMTTYSVENELIITNNGEGTLFYEILANADWVTYDINEGSLTQDENELITFTLDASELVPDQYTAEIIISSNDPANPQIFIPVTLNVIPIVDNHPNQLPLVTAMNSVYPNPFNPRTTFAYSLKESGNIDLTIYNITGQKVANLVSSIQKPGNYTVSWNANNQASGIYFYKFSTESTNSTGKVILMK